MQTLIVVAISLGLSVVLAMAIGMALGFFREKFKVERNPLIDQTRAALPGVNCGACGYSGCEAYAVAMVEAEASTGLCTSGGAATAQALGVLLGRAAQVEDMVSVLRCQGARSYAPPRGEYSGVKTCRAAKIATGGIKACPWGCMGFGDCVAVCAFGALRMDANGLPDVDYLKCVGCGMCVKECPQGLFLMVPKARRRGAITLCSNRSLVKVNVSRACKIGCIKCEICVKNCPKGAIRMENQLPVVDYSLCDSCGTCVQKCPTKAFNLLESIEVEG